LSRTRHLANVLLDSPRWVETREMLMQEDAEIFGLSGNRRSFVAASPHEQALIAVVGRPDAAFIQAAAQARAHPGTEVLCAEENFEYVAQALGDWHGYRAQAFAWPGDVPLPQAQRDVSIIERSAYDRLDVPAALRLEFHDGSPGGPLVAALDGGRPVAFCYPSAVTETLWDVSVDTLEGYRRRGHAGRAFRHLAHLLGARNRWPVWLALDRNLASLGLARKLGFEPAERLALFIREPLAE